MHSQNPFKISEVNPEQIFFKNIKESENKKIIFIKYKDDNVLRNMVFQLPTLINDISLDNNEVEVTIDCVETTKTKKVIDLINSIDEKIVNEAKKNAHVWFDHVEDKTKINFHHSLRSNENNDTIKLKIIDSKEFKTNIILNNNESDKISLNEIPTNGKLKLVLECYAVWIHGDTFGIILRPVILSFIMDVEKEYNYKILDDSESEISESDNEHDMLFIKSEEPKIKLDILNTLNSINSSLSSSDSSSDLNDQKLNKIIFNVSKL